MYSFFIPPHPHLHDLFPKKTKPLHYYPFFPCMSYYTHELHEKFILIRYVYHMNTVFCKPHLNCPKLQHLITTSLYTRQFYIWVYIFTNNYVKEYLPLIQLPCFIANISLPANQTILTRKTSLKDYCMAYYDPYLRF